MTGPSTCGEALVALLEGYGVDTVFGMPGTHTLELYRGLDASSIRHVLVRHEQGAGFMADGYARASGRPGVCFVITGPGVTNVLTAIGEAWSDSVPMLIFSSTLATRDLGKGLGRLHEIPDQRAVSAPLTAFSATARTAAEVPELVARAFAVFASERPRPVHIELPLDVIRGPAEGDWTVRQAPARPEPAAADIEAARGLLVAAERPVVIAGGGAVAAAPSIRRLVDTLGCAAITTTSGKGIVPDGHPLALGAVLPRKPGVDFAAAADVVLAIGTELAATDHWLDRLPLTGKIIRVDLDAAKLADEPKPTVAIKADAAATAALLADAVTPGPAAARVEETERRVAATLAAIAADDPPHRSLHRRVLGALKGALPADALVLFDVSQIAYSGIEVYPATVPGTWLHPVGYCTLGWAVPAALGAKLAAPERAVVAVIGDGGFQFTHPELATAADLGISVPVVLWNNRALNEIRDQMIERGIQPVGVQSVTPDFQALAGAMGCRAVLPESLGGFEAAVSEALTHPGLTLIEVRQDADWVAG